MSKRQPKLGPSEPREGAETSAPARDLVLVGGRVDETGGYRVLRQRDDRVEIGELRTLEHGKALRGEIVRLHPTETHGRVFECETLHDTTARTDTVRGDTTPENGEAPNLETSRGRPAQVASDAYRRNWEQIFGTIARELDVADDEAPAMTDPRKLN